MITEALLVSLVAIVATIDYNGPIFLLHRPLITGALTGLVLGDLTQGIIIGATLELMWLGVTGIGGYTPPDTISGAILGTAFAIFAGEGVEAGIAIAVPISLITQQLDVIAKTATIRFAHNVDNAAEEGNLSAVGRNHYLSLLVIILFKTIPIFGAVLAGSSYVEQLFNYIPDFVMTGLSVAGGILPAVGFGMLLNSMVKPGLLIFILIGFFSSTFLGLNTMGIAVIAIIVVFFYNLILGDTNPATEVSANYEEGYDL